MTRAARAAGSGDGAGRTIRVAAGIVVDADGRFLLVRKHGTALFMQPGGKLEPGESAAEALVRELAEEVGVVVPLTALVPRGTWRGAAANEPGHALVAEVFDVAGALAGAFEPVAAAEIAEHVWVDPAAPGAVPLAPLTRDLLAEAAGTGADHAQTPDLP